MKPRRKYRDIVKHISTLQLTQPDDVEEMTDEDLFRDLTQPRGSSLFLGTYSSRGILYALKKLGILDQFKARGLDNISVETDTSKPFRHRLRLYHREPGRDFLLVEAVLKRGGVFLSRVCHGSPVKETVRYSGGGMASAPESPETVQ